MKNFKNILFAVAILVVILTTNACQQAGGEVTGSEFIPEMAHSIANEANVLNYYNLNTWETEHGSAISLRDASMPRKPVTGTIPRGAAATSTSDASFGSPSAAIQHTMNVMNNVDKFIPISPNGSTPYYFEDSDTGRILATNQLIYNPYPITKDGLARGKDLYNTLCGICHGEKGDGNGWLVDEANPRAVYPAAPANLINEDFTATSNGRLYHAIIYGKNVMGGYTDKISYEERWQVIHWIRALQAKNAKLEYSENANTLNSEFGVPSTLFVETTKPMQIEDTHNDEMTGHDDDGEHSHDSEAASHDH